MAAYGTGAFGLGANVVITKKATEISPVVDVSVSYGTFNTFSLVLMILII
ncbi:MAG: hypothetical protein Ta2C_07710 [Candidatus Endomicrobiellum trichonymphae]|nr:hypothetical protein [Candidatus Endomicrobium trichonymphae]GMO54440.1 MAG: hypothetical protein Ta2C_07710 [Candidatus Endomicrobium trichonymphae]